MKRFGDRLPERFFVMGKIIKCRDCGEMGERKRKFHGLLCHECYKAYQKKWRGDNVEKRKVYLKKWRDDNVEKVKASNKKWRGDNPGYMKKWFLDHPGVNALISKKWRGDNPVYKKEKQREYEKARRLTPEYKEYWKAYFKTPKGKAKRKVYNAKYLTRKTEAGGSFTAGEWKALCDLYDNRCLCCGEVKDLTADHVIPVAKGGSSNIENIQPLCQSCNSSKSTNSTDYRTKPFKNVQLKLF